MSAEKSIKITVEYDGKPFEVEITHKDIEAHMAEIDKMREKALTIWPDGEADCKDCEINCHTFWWPEEPGGQCGHWGLPLKDKDMWAEIVPFDEEEFEDGSGI